MTVKFGRIPSPYDERDYLLGSFIPKGFSALLSQLVTSKTWAFNLPSLDQGSTPHCVGFSMADFGIAEPTEDHYTNSDGHNFYLACKQVDGMPTTEGSTVRAAAKVLKARGRITSYAFASTVDEIRWWVLNRGPVIMGTIWTEGMFNPDRDGVIHPTGRILGGHAWLIRGWDGKHFICQNSWGIAWGVNGTFKVNLEDMYRIWRQGGEAVTAVEVITPDEKKPDPIPPAPVTPEPKKKKKKPRK